MDNFIELELRKLGLSAKEVDVYLAGLELGPTSVQNIAKESGLTRPTVYEVIKKLEDKNLFTQSKQGKKRVFSAQSPEGILGILRIQKREIEEKEREFIRIISTLESKYLKGREGLKIFKGREGLESLAEIISFTSTRDIILINPQKIPIKEEKLEKVFSDIKKRLGPINLNKTYAQIAGGMIIFDKVAFFPSKDEEAFLLT